MFHIHEKLGDAFTDVGACCGSYASAINHYQQMVSTAVGVLSVSSPADLVSSVFLFVFPIFPLYKYNPKGSYNELKF